LCAQGLESKKALKPTILVDIGKPNAWTMEQAHYLLERNRAHDLGIAAQDLGPLDANEIVGYRLEAIKTLLSVQAQYDAATGRKNSATVSQYQQDLSRFRDLTARRDQIINRQTELAGQLASAQYQLAVLQAQTPPDQQKIQIQTAEVSRITALKAATDSELTSATNSLGTEPTLGSLTSAVPASDMTSATALGTNPVFTTMMQGLPQGLGNSKLQASLKLDNYINLQYEIVAKQLTLLRDQAGADRRVVFIELPQSIYATHKLKLYPDLAALWGNHLVQTWWRIDGALVVKRTTEMDGQPSALPTHDQLRQLLEPAPSACPPSASGPDDELRATLRQFFSNQNPSARSVVKPLPAKEAQRLKYEFEYEFVTSMPAASAWSSGQETPGQTLAGQRVRGSVPPPTEQSFYALDLIPRRSALNVADAQSSSRAFGFAGLFGLLTGLGGRARYERQRDQYQQFAQQETYASAFGKGQDVFGWTFGPLPGTKRLEPGLRTTYAVVVVPKDTRYVRLTGVGCGYRRRSVPKDPFAFALQPEGEECGTAVQYDVEIPSRDDGFFVDGITYRPVSSGQRITLELWGRFGTQIGVLVNGTPLQKVVSLSQPIPEQAGFAIPTNAGEPGIAGVFESVGSRQLVLSFAMPAAFVGTPRIAIVTPTRAGSINDYDLEISDGSTAPPSKETGDPPTRASTDCSVASTQKAKGRRLDDLTPMFHQVPTITRVSPQFAGTDVVVTLFGQGLGQGYRTGSAHALLLNGSILREHLSTPPTALAPDEYVILNPGVIEARFDRKTYYPRWQLDYLEYGGPQTVDAPIAYSDDGPPTIGSCELTETKEKETVTAVDITLKGQYFDVSSPPTVGDSKNVSITSAVWVSPEAWKLSATVAKNGDWRQAVLQVKNGKNPSASQIGLKTCAITR
jgi:hypothetical protein